MSEFILLELFMLLVFAAGSLVRKFDGYISPITVLGVGMAMYVMAIPLESTYSESPVLWVAGQIAFTHHEARTAALLAFPAFISVVLGYVLVANRKVSSRHILGDSPELKAVTHTVAMVCAFLFVVLLVRFPSELSASRAYSDSFGQRFTNPVFGAILRNGSMMTGMLTFLLLLRRKFASAFIVAAFTIFAGFFVNQKSPIVFAALALVMAINPTTFARIRPLRFGAAIVIAPIAMAVSTLAFSVYRGGGDVGWAALRARAAGGFMNRIEPAGPFWSLIVEIREPGASGPDSRPGESVLGAFIGWIPRAILPDRPVDLSMQFAQANSPRWTPGQGFGYSPMAEGLLQGGPVVMCIYFVFIGAFIAFVRNRLFSLHPKDPAASALWISFYSVGVMYTFFVFFRGPFQALVMALMQGLVTTMLLIAVHRLRLAMFGGGGRDRRARARTGSREPLSILGVSGEQRPPTRVSRSGNRARGGRALATSQLRRDAIARREHRTRFSASSARRARPAEPRLRPDAERPKRRAK